MSNGLLILAYCIFCGIQLFVGIQYFIQTNYFADITLAQSYSKHFTKYSLSVKNANFYFANK